MESKITREEQIKQAEIKYSNDTLFDGCDYIGQVAKQEAFIAGAKWADEHSDSNHTYTKQQLIDMGFAFTTNGDIVTPEQSNEDLKKYLQYQKQKFIEKACDWLVGNAEDSVESALYLVTKFKRAMEE